MEWKMYVLFIVVTIIDGNAGTGVSTNQIEFQKDVDCETAHNQVDTNIFKPGDKVVVKSICVKK